jgi:predicted Zn finger-like uncharacterized protein
MKFLCDNCKAKYQIGDEKVAGKTVRMKCRRCGHSITVSSKVTESSVSRPFPIDPAAQQAFDGAPDSGRFPTGQPSAPAPQPEPPQVDDDSTQIMQMPVIQPRPAAPTPLRPAGSPARPAPPRPGGAAPIAPRAPAPRAPAPQRPAPAQHTPAPAASAWRGPSGAPAQNLRVESAPAPFAPAPAPTPAPQEGGVAAAFQRAVAAPDATTSARTPPHEDWYVGVAGVPLGPVRIDVIREKAQLGQVDGDSLVWREGFDEWQPLKKFPELLEVVHGARMARLAQSSSRPPAPAPAPLAYAPAPTSAAVAAALAPVAASAPIAPSAASAFAPVATPDPFGPSAGLLQDPFGKPVAPGPSKPAPEPPEPSAAGVNLLGASADPFPHAAGPTSAELDRLVPRRGGMNPMALAFIAMAAVFGGVAAYVLFIKPPPQAQIVVVEKAVPGAPVASGAAPSPSSTDAEAAPAPSAGATSAPTGRVATGGHMGGPKSAPPATPAAGGTPSPIDTSGFTNGGVAGPSAAAPTPGGAAGSGQLSQGEIQGVISSNQARVRRQCWEPALAARSANGPTTARVSASITIGASGGVENVSASGADAFPGLSGCIASKLKNLKFPASGGSTHVAVPFVFAAQ